MMLQRKMIYLIGPYGLSCNKRWVTPKRKVVDSPSRFLRNSDRVQSSKCYGYRTPQRIGRKFSAWNGQACGFGEAYCIWRPHACSTPLAARGLPHMPGWLEFLRQSWNWEPWSIFLQFFSADLIVVPTCMAIQVSRGCSSVPLLSLIRKLCTQDIPCWDKQEIATAATINLN